MQKIRERTRTDPPRWRISIAFHSQAPIICSIAFLSLLALGTMAVLLHNFITIAPALAKPPDPKSDSFGRRRQKPFAASQRHSSHHGARQDQILTTQEGEQERMRRWSAENIAKIAVAVFAAGVVIIGPAADAMAAKTGGRVGGQAFRSAPPPRINNSRTNVFINPPIAPPIFGGYGFSTPFFGGWGWSPFSFFVPGPSVAIGVGGGIEIFGFLLVLAFVGSIIRSFLRRNDDDDVYYD